MDVLLLDVQLVVEVREGPESLGFGEDEVGGAVDHFEEAEGAVAGGCEAGWGDAAVEAHWGDGLGEEELFGGWGL